MGDVSVANGKHCNRAQHHDRQNRGQYRMDFYPFLNGLAAFQWGA